MNLNKNCPYINAYFDLLQGFFKDFSTFLGFCDFLRPKEANYRLIDSPRINTDYYDNLAR